MTGLSDQNFGIIIAYLLPGMIVLWGVSFQYETVAIWFYGDGTSEHSSIGGFLYSTVCSLLVGLFCTTLRWMIVDPIHHFSGIHRPTWNYAKLQANIEAYTRLEENHYRYYQFYANSLVAWFIAYGFWRFSENPVILGPHDIGFLFLSFVLFMGSRDTLLKYYNRVEFLLDK